MTKAILIVASLDTKGQEVKFLKELIEQRGHKIMLLDLSMHNEPALHADITCEEVAQSGGASINQVRSTVDDRSEITAIMIKGAIKKVLELYQSDKFSGIVGIGGVTNTAMATDIMKALPFGIPKLMVSSGAAMPRYAGSFFGSSDTTIASSVVDMAGLHPLSKSVLARAAGAICGMVEIGTGPIMDSLRYTEKPLVALTQFQYSEMCCNLIRNYLEEKDYLIIPCHADGVGDRAMESLIEQGIFDAVIDIVPGGLSEELLGGNRAAGADRLEAAGKRGIPQVLTPCGFEMISCGPIQRRDSNDSLWISRNLASRSYYVQDAYRVQARTNTEELRLTARTVAEKLNKAKGPVKFLIPMAGWSALSVKGQVLHNPDNDQAFVQELKKDLSPAIEVIELDMPLNSPDFTIAVTEIFRAMVPARRAV